MKVRSHRRFVASRASGLVLVLVLLAVVGVAASVVIPNLVKKQSDRSAADEEARIAWLGRGFTEFVEREQVIPGTNDWVAAVASVLGMNVNSVRQVFPNVPGNANTRRVLLVDPEFTPATGSGLLPFTQTLDGINIVAASVPGAHTRVMMVSSSHPGLALPFGEGIASATTFSNLWNWIPDPISRNPPAGFPAEWAGQGDHLHVSRISLRNLFHKVRLHNVQLTVGSVPVIPPGLETLLFGVVNQTGLLNISAEQEAYYLRGTHLKIFSLQGVMHVNHIVNKDCVFDLATTAGPLFYFKFSETAGKVAVNSGSLGSAGDGTYVNRPNVGQAGPRSPAFPGLPVNNLAVNFEEDTSYMASALALPQSIKGFTLGGWISQEEDMRPHDGIMGQTDGIALVCKNKNFIDLEASAGGTVTFRWPYGKHEWHHIVGTGDGETIHIYIDGAEVVSQSVSVTDYGNPSSSSVFQVGALQPGGTDNGNMKIDEVVFYDRALSASEVQQLYTGSIP